MEINTRNELENTIIASALYDEECFDILMEIGLVHTDFKFKMYRVIYDFIIFSNSTCY